MAKTGEKIIEMGPILITGASGVLGRSVVQAFAKASFPVRRGVRKLSEMAFELISEGGEICVIQIGG
jgi:short-subunit dehydrogenase